MGRYIVTELDRVHVEVQTHIVSYESIEAAKAGIHADAQPDLEISWGDPEVDPASQLTKVEGKSLGGYTSYTIQELLD